MVSEIDEIFSKSAKSKPVDQQKKKKTEEKKYDIRGSTVQEKEIYSIDGYKIYTKEELHIGRGGLTGKCPFDCNCCF